MTIETEFDIRACADRVVALLEQQRVGEALELLEQERHGQPLLVQESLDRYIASEAAETLLAFTPQGAVRGGEAAVSSVMARLQASQDAPRFPDLQETELLTVPQRYDTYASIVQTRGNQAAQDALGQQERVVLGLRQETSTLATSIALEPTQARQDDATTTNLDEANLGNGVYDDRLVVFWKDADGTRHVVDNLRATTDPTAQYDAHARPGPDRAATLYASVVWRRGEGADVNQDGIADLGRLAEGTVEMFETTHAASRIRRPVVGPNEFSLRPTRAAVADGEGLVQRDTNADGWFDQTDVNGVQDLNNTFKIRPGSRNSTDSAGCQTIHVDDYDNFVTAVRGNPEQTRWQYVLTSSTPGVAPEIDVDREMAPQLDPRQQRHPDGAPGGEVRGERGIGAEPAPVHAPLNGHDQSILESIRSHVRELDHAHGRHYDERSERISYSLLALAKDNGFSRVDHVVLSEQRGNVGRGDSIFLVRGRLDDPSHDRANLQTETAARTPVAESTLRLEALNQKMAHEQNQQQVLPQQSAREHHAQGVPPMQV